MCAGWAVIFGWGLVAVHPAPDLWSQGHVHNISCSTGVMTTELGRWQAVLRESTPAVGRVDINITLALVSGL